MDLIREKLSNEIELNLFNGYVNKEIRKQYVNTLIKEISPLSAKNLSLIKELLLSNKSEKKALRVYIILTKTKGDRPFFIKDMRDTIRKKKNGNTIIPTKFYFFPSPFHVF